MWYPLGKSAQFNSLSFSRETEAQIGEGICLQPYLEFVTI